MPAMNLTQRPAGSAVKRLLHETQLPTADLTDAHLEHFLACGRKEALEGVVGLELYPPVALLRSLAVAADLRGRGLGGALLGGAERYARSREVREIYLLTTTAERFFAHAGYERVQRDTVPAAIQATQEFSSLCPASSVVMRKRL
jgi:amino-acid N-acetyltransferase